MPTETSEAFALFLASGLLGFVQPFLQEAVMRDRLNGFWGQVATWATSALLTLIAIWATGGFATFNPPPFDWVDPSPFLAYFAVRFTPVRAIAWATFKVLRGRVKAFAETAPAT